MKLDLVFLGKTKEKYLDAGIKDYCDRLSRYVSTSITTLKERKKGGEERRIIIDEGKHLLEKTRKNSFVVALDPIGVELTSEQLAEKIVLWERQAVQNVSFLLGGPNGLSDEVRSRADFVLSLSKMTFTHEMARFILAEQLYRAFSIKAGSKYHK